MDTIVWILKRRLIEAHSLSRQSLAPSDLYDGLSWLAVHSGWFWVEYNKYWGLLAIYRFVKETENSRTTEILIHTTTSSVTHLQNPWDFITFLIDFCGAITTLPGFHALISYIVTIYWCLSREDIAVMQVAAASDLHHLYHYPIYCHWYALFKVISLKYIFSRDECLTVKTPKRARSPIEFSRPPSLGADPEDIARFRRVVTRSRLKGLILGREGDFPPEFEKFSSNMLS